MEEKYCPKCKEIKLTSNFSFLKSKKKYNSYCKSCASDSRLETYYKNPEAHREYNRQRKNKIKEQVNQLKIECIQCGENDYVCLEFHHIDPLEKDMNIADMVRKYGFTKIKKEIDKCVVLCANCHRKLHAGKLVLAPDGKAPVLHADID